MNVVTKGRLHFLDSLRGVAAIYVVLFHALLLPHPAVRIENPALAAFLHFGGTGVFLFFVISGFSLCLTMPKHEATGRPWLSYGVNRLFRIAPLFYVILALYAVHDMATQGAPNFHGTLYSAAFVFNLLPGRQEGVVWASWTIGVEMLFYAIFPLIYRRGLAVQAAILVGSALLFAAMRASLPDGYTYWTFVGWLPLFLIGMWSFAVYDRLSHAQNHRPIGAALIVAGAILLAICAYSDLAETAVWLRVPIALGYASVLIGFGLRQTALLSARVLRFYGRVSYSLYLVHAPIIVAIQPLYHLLAEHSAPMVAFLLFASVALALATAVAAVLYRVVEKAGIASGHWVFAKAKPRAAIT